MKLIMADVVSRDFATIVSLRAAHSHTYRHQENPQSSLAGDPAVMLRSMGISRRAISTVTQMVDISAEIQDLTAPQYLRCLA